MTEINTDQEKKELLSRYRKLLRTARPILNSGDAKLIKKAFSMSLDAHKDMRRKSGEPYIFHPLAVAQICVEEIGLGTTSIICALLHDVVEDTDVSLDFIEREFGKKVARIVDGLTKISGVFQHGSHEQAENFRKMLLSLSDDVRVILIKLADRLHNMRTLGSMAKHKQLRIASETMYLYAPLAHRLGLYLIKSELEDLYLKYTEQEVYRDIAKKINETKLSRERFIKNFIKPIKSTLERAGLNVEVKGRPKSIYSIWNKMKKQQIPFDEVYDLFAIRIIIDTDLDHEKSSCWQAYSIVTDFYQPNPDRLRDWVSIPKANGYESLHTTVMSHQGQWVEVQIRTRRMDDIAEKGYAAHWKYKENGTGESGLEGWISKVREVLERNDVAAIDLIDDFRSSLFQEEVFAFTPKGELKTLPKGATALDFAFEVHTEIGARCIGAKVNQKLVPITYVLNNGDQVEIITSSKQKPNEDWLKFVKTSKARTRIKDFLKEEQKAAASDGKEILQRKLKQLKLEMSNEVLDKLMVHYNLKTTLDVFYWIGSGKIDTKDLKKIVGLVMDQDRKRYRPINDARSFEQQIAKIRDEEKDTLLIGEDMNFIDYTFAKCCNPIAGDDVFGFVTVAEGIKIHRTTCPNAIELLTNYSYRIVKAKWTSQQKLAFLAGLRIRGTDRMGMVNDITMIISNELKVNMRSITVDTNEGIFEGDIQLYVNDTRHLDLLIQKLRDVSSIEDVVRYY